MTKESIDSKKGLIRIFKQNEYEKKHGGLKMPAKKKISLTVTEENYDKMKAVLDAAGVRFSDFIDMMLHQYVHVLEETNLTNKDPKNWTMLDVSYLFQSFSLKDPDEGYDKKQNEENVK